MVANVKKDDLRREFGRWLSRELIAKGMPESRGGPGWLKKELWIRGRIKISYESCRKWLIGLEFPEQAHLKALGDIFGISHSPMTGNLSPTKPKETDEQLEELLFLWQDLDTDGKDHVVTSAKLAKRASPFPARRTIPKTPSIKTYSRRPRGRP